MQKVIPFQLPDGERRGLASESDETTPISSALRTLNLGAEGLSHLAREVSGSMMAALNDAVRRLKAVSGRVIVTGFGKSGHIAQKIAATFASTGTPACFVLPSEASHGDLGMITQSDIIVTFSWSGETVELKPIITYSRRFAVPLIAVTSQANSSLGEQADVVLQLPRVKEACPHGLAPTTSTTIQLAIGDSLAIALLDARGFTANDFKIFHPGGSLGANLKYVSDIMHQGERLPLIESGASMGYALVAMTKQSFGCVGVTDANGKLIGAITDGDLRRHMGPKLLQANVNNVMTEKPKTIAPTLLASSALALISSSRITALFVVEKQKPIGIVHVHDLLRAGVA